MTSLLKKAVHALCRMLRTAHITEPCTARSADPQWALHIIQESASWSS